MLESAQKNNMGIYVKGLDKRGTQASGGNLQATDQLINKDFISKSAGEGILNSVSNEFASFSGLFPLVGHGTETRAEEKIILTRA